MLQNKYSRWYYSIIEKARDRLIEGYTERHHILPPEWKQRIGEASKGRLHTETYKAHMSTCKSAFWAKRKETGENYPIRVCPCGVSGRGPNMSRYHFDNCKKVTA